MSQKPDGGPAFARPVGKLSQEEWSHDQEGMSLRDWFAGQAIATCRVKVPLFGDEGSATADCAAVAYRIADAMLAERSKP